MKLIFILLAMLFLHVVDDFYLQGILANLKQKKWWRDNYNYRLYQNDYIVALIIHSFSWSFMIHLPVVVANYEHLQTGAFLAVFAINMFVHGIVDDLKANKLKINLITDQFIHFCQIIITWSVLCLWLTY